MNREEKIKILELNDRFNSGEKLSKQEKATLLEARESGVLGGGGGLGGAGGGVGPAADPLQSDQSFMDYATETAQDIGVGAMEGATAGFSDEALGAAVAAFRKSTGDTRPADKLYSEARDALRELQQTGKSRSPWAYFLGDLAGGVANPLGKLVKGGSTAARYTRGVLNPKNFGQAAVSGAVQGVGYSESQEPSDMIAPAVLGAGIGGTSQALMSFGRSAVKNPDAIRASALGASKKDFTVKGPQSRANMVKTLKDKGFYSLSPAQWDNNKRKFVKIAEEQGLDVQDRFMTRAMDAIEQLADENNRLLSNVVIDPDTLNKATAKTLAQSKKGTLPQTAQEQAEDFLNKWTAENLPPGDITASSLENLKRTIQEELKSTYANLGAGDAKIQRQKDLLMSLQSNLKEVLEKSAGSARYAENNKIQSALYTQLRDLEKQAAKEAAGSGKPFAGKYQMVAGLVDDATGGTARDLGRAAIGDKLNQYAELARVLGIGTQQAPQKVMSTMMNSPENSQGRSPDAVLEEARSYNFSRVKSLMNMPLPRDTEALSETYKPMLIQKAYHQISPEAAGYLEKQFEMYGPQQMQPILRKFVTDNPNLFEVDEYNRVDGVITDDLMKKKAMQDISKAPISAIQKARLTDGVLNNKRNLQWPKQPE